MRIIDSPIDIKIDSGKKNKTGRNIRRKLKGSKRINVIAKLECIVIGEEILYVADW